VAVVGGLTLGTLLTLFVVPPVYSVLTGRNVGGALDLSELERDHAA